jgi:hypothetical protein
VKTILRLGFFASIACAAFAACMLAAGCQSPWVQATIVNDEFTPVSLVEVHYPGGNFGVQTIAARSSFQYRFHILGNEPATIEFTDAAGHTQTVKGPELDKGEEGLLVIDIRAGDKVMWSTALHPRN